MDRTRGNLTSVTGDKEAPWERIEAEARAELTHALDHAARLLDEASGWASAIGQTDLRQDVDRLAGKIRVTAAGLGQPTHRISDEARRLREGGR